MIKAYCFEKAWIDAFKGQEKYRRLNPPVLEKMINALYLLQLLKKSDCQFIFKGGTSLILILDIARRFSVDIDIITRHSKEEIEACLQKVVDTSNFTSWQLDERRSYKKGVPKAHYELDYPSNINRDAGHIQLDILFEDSHYPKTLERQIISPWIETEELITVTVPTVESIAGDKLTAFATNTTGITFGKGKETEIIKQLFDIGYLFDEASDTEEIHSSFHAFVVQEIKYRNLDTTKENVLWDIIETSKLLGVGGRLKVSDQPERNNYDLLMKGLKAFESFLIEGRFRLDDSILAGAKAGYLAAKILSGNKRIPAAYFYWHKALTLLHLAK